MTVQNSLSAVFPPIPQFPQNELNVLLEHLCAEC